MSNIKINLNRFYFNIFDPFYYYTLPCYNASTSEYVPTLNVVALLKEGGLFDGLLSPIVLTDIEEDETLFEDLDFSNIFAARRTGIYTSWFLADLENLPDNIDSRFAGIPISWSSFKKYFGEHVAQMVIIPTWCGSQIQENAQAIWEYVLPDGGIPILGLPVVIKESE